VPPTCAPLPLTVLERIKEFVEQRRTGQVALNFREGAFMGFDLREHFSVGAAPTEKNP
jgi:hypothetical protein